MLGRKAASRCIHNNKVFIRPLFCSFLKLTLAGQIRRARVCPYLVHLDLIVLVEFQHIRKDLIPTLPGARPGEPGFSTARYLRHICIDNKVTEAHILVFQVGRQELEILFESILSPEFTP